MRGRPRPRSRRTWTFWSTQWIDPHERLRAIEHRVAAAGARIQRGGDYDRWDLEVEVGVLVRERLLMSVEEHGGGAQLIRVRAHLRATLPLAVGAIVAALALVAALDQAYLAAALLGGLGVAFLTWFFSEASAAAGVVAHAVEHGVEHGVEMNGALQRPRASDRWPLKLARGRRDGSAE